MYKVLIDTLTIGKRTHKKGASLALLSVPKTTVKELIKKAFIEEIKEAKTIKENDK